MFKITTSLLLSVAISAACAQGTTTGSLPSCSQIGLGQGASLNGFVPFPVSDPINQNISTLPVDPSSANIVGLLSSIRLHPDFGAGTYGGINLGMPYEVVGPQTLETILYTEYGAQSDPGPMPIPTNAPVEGAGLASADHHVLVLSQNTCFLYELFRGALQPDGSWTADSGSVWDLLSDNARPYTWTSADAAGLPVFPLLARYDEVASGAIHHALRFTLAHTRNSFIAPATHEASSSPTTGFAPMGARFRLKASYDISGFTPQAKIILQALKTYGMIVADNGSNMFLSGDHDARWNNADLANLHNVPASAFEIVNTGPAWTNATAPKGPAPVITSFTSSAGTSTPPSNPSNPILGHGSLPPGKTSSATTTQTTGSVAAGTSVTLTWAATGASYFVVTPAVGAVRGNSATVKPTKTTTYTLVANSHFGTTTKTVTVTVQ